MKLRFKWFQLSLNLSFSNTTLTGNKGPAPNPAQSIIFMGGEGAGKILALSSMFPYLKFASIFAFYFQLSGAIFAAFGFFGGRGLSSL